MIEGKPSLTALATAFMRAYHVALDLPPPVLDDRVSEMLLPAPQRRYLKRQARLPPAWRPRSAATTAMRGQIVVRARYAEDSLAEARRTGASRLVILGAGLDTFALRQPAPAVEVIEIDHPATQQWKRQLLRGQGFELPAGLEFLPVDFERSSLGDLWPEHGAPEFISWLGTTYYLSRDAITATLAVLAGRAQAGSQLVLDYWRERPRPLASPLLWGTRIATALQGEPMRSFFEPAEIERLALQAGWRVMENCPPSEQRRRYLAHRGDRLAVPSFAYLLRLEKAAITTGPLA